MNIEAPINVNLRGPESTIYGICWTVANLQPKYLESKFSKDLENLISQNNLISYGAIYTSPSHLVGNARQ